MIVLTPTLINMPIEWESQIIVLIYYIRTYIQPCNLIATLYLIMIAYTLYIAPTLGEEKQKKITSHLAGLEPATFRLTAERTTNCAASASLLVLAI